MNSAFHQQAVDAAQPIGTRRRIWQRCTNLLGMMSIMTRQYLAFLLGAATFIGWPSYVDAAVVLVADRLSNSVYRYSETGALLGTVVEDNVNINQATGLALSPDLTTLYVSSFQNSRVVRYDYNNATGTASNPTIFAEGFADNLVSPNSILFSQDGKKIYVSNLGGSGVARFNVDGSSAGAPLTFPTPPPPGFQPFFQFSGLAQTPSGELLVAAFQDFPAGANGKVGRLNATGNQLEGFLSPAPSLNGASGLLVNGDYLYVSSMFASNIQRFKLTDGELDPSFNVTDLVFPQGLQEAPDGNGFLVSILGFADGQGHIARYDFDGNLLGTFANPGSGGFTEGTAFIVVEDRLLGDYNRDDIVDAADYVVWRNAGPTAMLPNDDSPGVVDGSDYNDWRANFGQTALANSAAFNVRSVPEPASLLPLVFSLVALGTMRSRQ